MNTINRYTTAVALAAALALAGCANPGGPGYGSNPYGTDPYGANSSNPANSYPPTYPVGANASSQVRPGYGVLQSIERVQPANTRSGIGGSGIGLGAVAGAVVGGIVGNQVGEGTGKAIATAVGVAGGAYAGHVLQNQTQNQQVQQDDDYRFTVRMEQGAYQTLTQAMTADFRVGDRVHIDNVGVLRRY